LPWLIRPTGTHFRHRGVSPVEAWLPGSERGRQVHLDAHDGRPHLTHLGTCHHLRSQVRGPSQPRTRGRRDAGRFRPACRPHRPRDPHHRPADDGATRPSGAETLELVSLTETEADRRVGKYSLGMRQRLGIHSGEYGMAGPFARRHGRTRSPGPLALRN